jgi:ectoine hydroxylase-related dioxygenase (phytanoyl-CoA dioxygenase family)
MKSINLADRPQLTAREVAEHTYLVRTQGFTILHDFLTVHETGLLKKTMESALKDYKPVAGVNQSLLDRYQLHDLINRDINYGRLLEDPRLQQLLEPLLGEHWIMYAATSSSIPPRGNNHSSRLHVDSPRFHHGYIFNVGVIWVLDDYEMNNGGALKMLPGSQHSEIEPDLDIFEKYCVHAVCKAGALLMFNARTFHRTGDNSTDVWNHSMTLNACRSFMKQRMDWVRFIPEEISRHLNGQARRIIGFDTRLPASLDEFFLPEEQRFYKPNQG